MVLGLGSTRVELIITARIILKPVLLLSVGVTVGVRVEVVLLVHRRGRGPFRRGGLIGGLIDIAFSSHPNLIFVKQETYMKKRKDTKQTNEKNQIK
jgi:hypothetical protein